MWGTAGARLSHSRISKSKEACNPHRWGNTRGVCFPPTAADQSNLGVGCVARAAFLSARPLGDQPIDPSHEAAPHAVGPRCPSSTMQSDIGSVGCFAELHISQGPQAPALVATSACEAHLVHLCAPRWRMRASLAACPTSLQLESRLDPAQMLQAARLHCSLRCGGSGLSAWCNSGHMLCVTSPFADRELGRARLQSTKMTTPQDTTTLAQGAKGYRGRAFAAACGWIRYHPTNFARAQPASLRRSNDFLALHLSQ